MVMMALSSPLVPTLPSRVTSLDRDSRVVQDSQSRSHKFRVFPLTTNCGAVQPCALALCFSRTFVHLHRPYASFRLRLALRVGCGMLFLMMIQVLVRLDQEMVSREVEKYCGRLTL